MAPRLRDLQAAFVEQVLAPDSDAAALSIAGDSIPATARLRIHRHHILASLGKVLAATYCTVHALVGEDYFKALSRTFIGRTLPEGPVLAEYGSDFPAFLDNHASKRELPYLADAARLDWGLNVAFHSPLEPSLTRTDLALLTAEDLLQVRATLTAGTILLRSVYPLDQIWAAARSEATEGAIALDAGPARLLVFRQADGAGFATLGEGEAAFVAALRPGSSLELAAAAGAAAEPGFDLSTAFARLLDLGVLLQCSKDNSVTV